MIQPPDADLAAPLALRDSCQVLREIMSVYESSVLGDENPEEQRRGFKQILDAAVDPALEMCRRMADMNNKDATGWNRSVFLINCLDYLQVNHFSTCLGLRSYRAVLEHHATFCIH